MPETVKVNHKTKAADEVFCHSCGNAIKSEAVVCVHCGVETTNSKINSVQQQPQASSVVQPKDKTVSILLAVFLGFWTWLYTYRVDAWKFWLNLGLTVVTLGFWGFIAWVWSIIDVAVKDDVFYSNYPNTR